MKQEKPTLINKLVNEALSSLSGFSAESDIHKIYLSPDLKNKKIQEIMRGISLLEIDALRKKYADLALENELLSSDNMLLNKKILTARLNIESISKIAPLEKSIGGRVRHAKTQIKKEIANSKYCQLTNNGEIKCPVKKLRKALEDDDKMLNRDYTWSEETLKTWTREFKKLLIGSASSHPIQE
jgi:hypothetical protein